MRILLTVRGAESNGDELRAMRQWLVAEEDFRLNAQHVREMSPAVPAEFTAEIARTLRGVG